MSTAPPILWHPDAERIERSTLTRYSRWLAASRGLETGTYDELWRWAAKDLPGLLGALLGVRLPLRETHDLRDRGRPRAHQGGGVVHDLAAIGGRGRPPHRKALLGGFHAVEPAKKGS